MREGRRGIPAGRCCRTGSLVAMVPSGRPRWLFIGAIPDQQETGATAALPIWIDFMRSYIDKYGDRNNPPQFDAPGNIAFVRLDSGVTEAFINGTQPQGLEVVLGK